MQLVVRFSHWFDSRQVSYTALDGESGVPGWELWHLYLSEPVVRFWWNVDQNRTAEFSVFEPRQLSDPKP